MDNATVGWLSLLMPEVCATEFFVNFNFFHVACLKIVVSKILGYGVILGATIVKVPQIVKLSKAHSACGINIYSVLLELLAVTSSAAYAISQKFPFSSYGESLFLVLQTAIIVSQVFYYNNGINTSLYFLLIYAANLFYLVSPSVPLVLVSALQAANNPIIIISKSIQFYTNYTNGSTGELSAITVFLLFLGSIARIFTSIQETGDTLVIVTYLTSTTFNGLIAAQILYYWNSKPRVKKE